MASTALDVDLYAKTAIEKLDKEKDSAEKQVENVEGESH
jgi:hypothetical protein